MRNYIGEKISIMNSPNEDFTILKYKKGGSLIFNDINDNDNSTNIINKNILNEDVTKMSRLETSSLAIFPALIERLILCKKLNENVDPERDMVLGLKLNPEYLNYLKGLVSASDNNFEIIKSEIIKRNNELK